tara:strand:- start:103807 stop:104397 length:591 start_codon:yes stop_codon:yes gene_type:complete
MAWADFRVLDPNGILRRHQGLPYQQAFTCDNQSNKLVKEMQSCEITCNFFCRSVCVSFPNPVADAFYAEECSPQYVKVYSDGGMDILVTRQDYMLSGNNWILSFLKKTSKFVRPDEGKMFLRTKVSRQRTIVENGVSKSVIVYLITGEYQWQEGTQTEVFYFYYYPEAENALNQLVEFGLGEPMWEDTEPFLELRN